MRIVSSVAFISLVHCAENQGIDPRQYDSTDWAIFVFNLGWFGAACFVIYCMIALWVRDGYVWDRDIDESELRSELRRHRRYIDRD